MCNTYEPSACQQPIYLEQQSHLLRFAISVIDHGLQQTYIGSVRVFFPLLTFLR
ncbi:hypothetical protein VIBNISO65_330001 [Vibrio nigripulchritudo SO65]|nr:hypothetical protein VIBNIAM115_1640002 [Vibrio nigripulchritudo AM115]CCN41750.1 hypothetical protein VIBNIFTn2_20002 [Vibrio nigripulchritudo FTn2]CCN63619.1 hypothetical protein VIBNIPon4_1370002 [Vibrio nigripulchritudo POn4]CCN77677.1 hypothetical protein VIBNISO65_330001 [Vibrio nigripulchritudo SO65]